MPHLEVKKMLNNFKVCCSKLKAVSRSRLFKVTLFVFCFIAAIVDISGLVPSHSFSYLNLVFSGSGILVSLLKNDLPVSASSGDTLSSIQLISVSNWVTKGKTFQYQPILSADYCLFNECGTSQYIIPILSSPSKPSEESSLRSTVECNFEFSPLNFFSNQIQVPEIKIEAFSSTNQPIWHRLYSNPNCILTGAFPLDQNFFISIILFNISTNIRFLRVQYCFLSENASGKRIKYLVNGTVLLNDDMNKVFLLEQNSHVA